MALIGLSYYVGEDPVIEVIWLFGDQLFASFQVLRNSFPALFAAWRHIRISYKLESLVVGKLSSAGS